MNDQLAQRQRVTPGKNKRFTQGLFTPKNPHKYMGDPTKIRYMSSWELETHKFFDNNEKVLRWGSEVIAIPYLKPTTGKMHKYLVDYFVEYINRDGVIVRELIEVKPLSQVKAPRSNSKHKLYEQLTYAINIAKWEAAAHYAKQHNMVFKILTEKQIFS